MMEKNIRKLTLSFFLIAIVAINSTVVAGSLFEPFLLKPTDIINKKSLIKKTKSPKDYLHPYLGSLNSNKITHDEIVLILNEKVVKNPSFISSTTESKKIFNTSDFNVLSDDEKVKCVILNRDFLSQEYPDCITESKGEEIKNTIGLKVKLKKIPVDDRVIYEIKGLLDEILAYKKFQSNLELLSFYLLDIDKSKDEKELVDLAKYLDSQNKINIIPLNVLSFSYENKFENVTVSVKKKKVFKFIVEKQNDFWKIADINEFKDVIITLNSLLEKKKGKR